MHRLNDINKKHILPIVDITANSATSLEAITTILDSLDALVYVADIHTHELIFIN